MVLEHRASRWSPRRPLDPEPDPRGRCSFRCARAASAAPTSTSSTATSTSRSCRSFPGTRSSGWSSRSGEGAERFAVGERVGVPWLGWTCGECRYCVSGRENLCERARFTGYTLDGGYAEQVVADERFCFPLPDGYSDLDAAPLLCAGLIGYRSLRLCGDPERLGLYGFGGSAHIVCQVAATRGDGCSRSPGTATPRRQEFARSLGAEWAGGSETGPPEPLDAAIVFAPVGELVPLALRALAPGGSVVCAGIHMSDIPAFPYEILWGERQIRSVANLTRADGEEFLRLAPQGSGSHPGQRLPARRGQRRHSTTCARVGSTAQPY